MGFDMGSLLSSLGSSLLGGQAGTGCSGNIYPLGGAATGFGSTQYINPAYYPIANSGFATSSCPMSAASSLTPQYGAGTFLQPGYGSFLQQPCGGGYQQPPYYTTQGGGGYPTTSSYSSSWTCPPQITSSSSTWSSMSDSLYQSSSYSRPCPNRPWYDFGGYNDSGSYGAPHGWQNQM